MTTQKTTTPHNIEDIASQFERARAGAHARAAGAAAHAPAAGEAAHPPAAGAAVEVAPAAVPQRNPLLDEYVQLAAQLADRMTDDELQAGIEDIRQQLDLRDTLVELNSVRESLQKIIAAQPESQAASQARRVLSGLDVPHGT